MGPLQQPPACFHKPQVWSFVNMVMTTTGCNFYVKKIEKHIDFSVTRSVGLTFVIKGWLWIVFSFKITWWHQTNMYFSYQKSFFRVSVFSVVSIAFVICLKTYILLFLSVLNILYLNFDHQEQSSGFWLLYILFGTDLISFLCVDNMQHLDY